MRVVVLLLAFVAFSQSRIILPPMSVEDVTRFSELEARGYLAQEVANQFYASFAKSDYLHAIQDTESYEFEELYENEIETVESIEEIADYVNKLSDEDQMLIFDAGLAKAQLDLKAEGVFFQEDETAHDQDEDEVEDYDTEEEYDAAMLEEASFEDEQADESISLEDQSALLEQELRSIEVAEYPKWLDDKAKALKEKAAGLAKAAKNVAKKGLDVVKKGVDKVKDTAKKVKDKVKDTVKKGVDKAKNAAKKVKDTVKKGIDKAKDKYNAAKKKISDKVNHYKDKAKGYLNKAKEKVKGAANKFLDKAKEAGKKAKDLAKKGLKAVGDAANAVKNWVKKMWNKYKCKMCTSLVGRFVSGLAEKLEDKAIEYIVKTLCGIIVPPVTNGACPAIVTPLITAAVGPLSPMVAKGLCTLAKPLIKKACEFGAEKAAAWAIEKAKDAIGETSIGKQVAKFFEPANLCGKISLC